jgi:hypothetical protein
LVAHQSLVVTAYAVSEYHMKEQQKQNPKAPENASLRLGLQKKLAERVVDARENPDALNHSRQARFSTNGECEAAPRVDSVGR